MLEKIKQLICFHSYKPIKLFYIEVGDNNLYTIYLTEQRQCIKCNKLKEKIIISYRYMSKEERDTIKDLLENRGAVNYIDLINNEINRKE